MALSVAAGSAWAVDPFKVRDIRVEGLQRVEAGTVFASLPVRVGDTYDDEKGAAAIQALFGLGLFKGTVSRFQTSLHVPHTGWNELVPARVHPVLEPLGSGGHVYFVHSFRPTDTSPGEVLATSDYDGPFTAAVASGSAIGFQCHPEKSGQLGLALLHAWMNWRP
jgi:imidazole glycerol phosphate synthase glutamine amidotransferase subunit